MLKKADMHLNGEQKYQQTAVFTLTNIYVYWNYTDIVIHYGEHWSLKFKNTFVKKWNVLTYGKCAVLLCPLYLKYTET